MTISQYESGKKLMKKTQVLQKFQRAFHEPFINSIKACAYDGRNDNSQELIIESDSELYKLIDDYVERQLAEIKKQFDEI